MKINEKETGNGLFKKTFLWMLQHVTWLVFGIKSALFINDNESYTVDFLSNYDPVSHFAITCVGAFFISWN